MMTTECRTQSADATEGLAEKLGQRLRGGETIELVSDIGGGKTTFVHGLARGIGSTDAVASPTFTLSRVYSSKDVSIHHFDLYRIDDARLLQHELLELQDDSQTVIVIEWAQAVERVLPKQRITVRFTPASETDRRIHIKADDSLAYAVEGLC